MPRYKLTIEYDGTPYCGWQRQDNGSTVQGSLEAAAEAICGVPVRVHGAGRTDAGCMRAAKWRIATCKRSCRPAGFATRSTPICGRSRSR